MEVVSGYFDLCVSSKLLQSKRLEVLKKLYEYGYRTIAVNYTVEEGTQENNAPKRKQPNVSVVPAIKVIEVPKEFDDLKILYRLTISFSTFTFLLKITKSPLFKKYHIVAVNPQNEAVFNQISTSTDFDIISLKSVSIHRKQYQQFVSRNVYFELRYADMLGGESNRKALIQLAHKFHLFGKSKNIIISSGAEDLTSLRSVYDIISMGLLFGLSQAQCKAAVMQNPKDVFYHSVARKSGKISVFATEDTVLELSSSDEEIVDVNGEGKITHRLKKMKTAYTKIYLDL